MKRTLKVSIFTIVTLLLGITYNNSLNNNSSCINVYVDFGVLDNNSKIIECVPANGEQKALSILSQAGIIVSGTEKYGNQIVCRVNNLPSSSQPIGIKEHESYVEKCKDMPAEFAYWALLVRFKSAVPDKLNPTGGWGWSQVGAADLKLNPGDSIGLVFSENENVAFPS